MGLLFTAFAQESESSSTQDPMPEVTREPESKGRHVFHKAGSTEIYRSGPMLSEFMLTAEQTEGRYSIVKEVFEPRMSNYPWPFSPFPQ